MGYSLNLFVVVILDHADSKPHELAPTDSQRHNHFVTFEFPKCTVGIHAFETNPIHPAPSSPLQVPQLPPFVGERLLETLLGQVAMDLSYRSLSLGVQSLGHIRPQERLRPNFRPRTVVDCE